jgi:hypothetical protein
MSIDPTQVSYPPCNKTLCTNFTCAICSQYGHYTHHCPDLPQFQDKLGAIHQTTLQEPTQMIPQISTSTESNPYNIYYVSTSVNSHHTFPCALCGQLDHFTYMCPLITKYHIHRMIVI